MVFPRMTAALFVLVLVGSLSLVLVSAVWFSPTVSHGPSAQAAHGTITAIGPGRDFVLQTKAGQLLHFQCGDRCRASLEHMQRHKVEKAATDVYFVQGANRLLIALDVD